MRPVVVIGLLGATLDAGKGPQRWERWRPTVDLCRHEDLVVARLELLHQPELTSTAEVIERDVGVVSPETTVRRHKLRMRDPWDFEEVYGALHDFARAYPFRIDDEDYLVHITTGTHVAQICLYLLTESRRIPGRLVQTSPALRRREGVGTFAIIDLDLSRYDAIARRFADEHEEGLSFLKEGIATRSALFNDTIDRVEQVALASRAPILLMGPTGAGKTRLARRIYELQRERRLVSGAFVEVNCATIRGDGAMSTLFGHVRGSFTGSVADRAGLLRAADGGVLFLDEVGELGLDEQAMLLRALESGRFLPVGSDREVGAQLRLLCGTNRDLARAVVEGRFREDLLHRINLWTFELPGLAARAEDIEPNVDFELERHAEALGRRVTFSREARTAFLGFATSPQARWPGNFRELSAVIERLATLAPGGRIDEPLVEREVEGRRRAWQRDDEARAPAGAVGRADPLATLLSAQELEGLDPFDRVQLAFVVDVCQRSRTLAEAGRALFAASRARRASVNDSDRLRKYLARWSLTFHDVAASAR